MGNAVSQALCEEQQEEKPQEQSADSGDAGSDDSGNGGARKAPASPERKNVGDDAEASKKETDAAKEQHSGAQASSKIGQSEPVSVRKASHEEAEQNKKAHDASGGNKGTGANVSAPEPEEGADEEEEEEAPPEIQVKTAPYDPRFPATNQARNCYTRYNEFYKCVAEKDEEDPECKFYQRAYRSICPAEWVEGWNTAREEGSWFGKY